MSWWRVVVGVVLAALGGGLLVASCSVEPNTEPPDTARVAEIDEGNWITSWCAVTTPGVRIFDGGRENFAVIADPSCKGKP